MGISLSKVIVLAAASLALLACGESTHLPNVTGNAGGDALDGVVSEQPFLTDVISYEDHPNANWSGSPVYLIISGYGSCGSTDDEPRENPFGTNLYRAFSQNMGHRLTDESYEGINNWVVACQPRDEVLTLFYSSRDPSRLQQGVQLDLHSEAAEISREKRAPVIVIGHSYGGAYAMQAAMKIPNDVPVRYLITLDAISPVHCRPQQFINLAFGRISQFMGKNNPDAKGCNEAPREYEREHRELISHRVAMWKNYYQQHLLSLLQSGRMDQACNQHVSHEGFFKSINGHVAMEFYPKLWRHIDTMLPSRVPSHCIESKL